MITNAAATIGPYLTKSTWRSRQAVQSASARDATPATTSGGKPSRLLPGSSVESASVRSLPSLQRLSSCKMYIRGTPGLGSCPGCHAVGQQFRSVQNKTRFYLYLVDDTMKIRKNCRIYRSTLYLPVEEKSITTLKLRNLSRRWAPAPLIKMQLFSANGAHKRPIAFAI